MNKEEYIKTLTDQIRCKMARPEVAREIEDHIEDQTRAFMSEGMNRQEAESAALKDMGNPVDAGVELDKVHRPAMPWGMIALIIVLSVAGYVFQYILNSRNIEAGGDGFFASHRQIWFTVFGILVMIAVCFADYTRIAARARELMIGITVLIVLGGQFFSLNINGVETMDRYSGRLGCNYTACTDADSSALCSDSVWIQRKRTGCCSEECVVDNPGVSSGMAQQQYVDGLYSLSDVSGCTGAGGLPQMVSFEKKGGARGNRRFVVGLPLVTACYYWFFRCGLSEGTASLLSLSGCRVG